MQWPVLVLAALLAGLGAAADRAPSCPPSPPSVQLPNATASGYLTIDDQGSRLFFLYYEQDTGPGDLSVRAPVPITVWLQGGPGCASLFGAFYELGPELVDSSLNLQANPGSWNRQSALLFIDQPVGAGFSQKGGRHSIPADEMTLAADLYCGLQAFFKRYDHLQERPLVIAGESYAGKYVPSIGHFILQQSIALGGTRSRGRLQGGFAAPGSEFGSNTSGAAPGPSLQHRPVPASLAASRPLLGEPPVFELRGLVIGNGLTDPLGQVMTHADTAYFMGYIDPRQRLHAMAMQLETVQLISAGLWDEAHSLRDEVLEHIRSSAGVATLLDMRRYEDYDAQKLVDCYLNLPQVKESLGVDASIEFESCSEEVGEALGPDVMKSVKYLVPDLLLAYPVLLYQGMWDAQDGPASSEAWISSLDWEGKEDFAAASRKIFRQADVDCDGGGSSGGSKGCLSSTRCGQDQGGGGDGGSGRGATQIAGSSADGGGGDAAGGHTASSSSTSSSNLRLGDGALGPRQERRLMQDLRHPHAQHDLPAAEMGDSQQQEEQARQQSQDEQQQQQAGSRRQHQDASGDKVVAYWKHARGLSHVVLTEAGHMVPRDAPHTARCMIERWLQHGL